MSATYIDNGLRPGPVQGPDLANANDRSSQFLRYFGFRESPFGVTPNPAFLFSSKMHREALQSIIDSIESNLGFTVLLGDPGMGKTTLLLQILSQYRDKARTAFIFQTQCRRHELLRYLAADLGLENATHDEVSLHQQLAEMLVNEARARRKVLIFIDEAQNLHHSSLEAVRLLSDFETPTAKLLHIILAGSARLGETLLGTELSQLAQRVSTICRLNPLAPEEIDGYITYRLRVAGCSLADTLFSPEALSDVAKESKGVPRVINSLCHRALYLAYAMGEPHISSMLVQQAAKDLDLTHSPSPTENFLRQSPPIKRPARPSAVPDLFFSEERYFTEPKATPQKVSRSEMPDVSAHAKEKRFRSPLISAADGSAAQSPGSRAKESVAPRRVSTGVPKPSRVSRYHKYLGLERGASAVRNLKFDRFTVLLAVLSFILITMGSWTLWSNLQSRRVAHQVANTLPVTPSSTDRSPVAPDNPVSPDNNDRHGDLVAPQLDPAMVAGKTSLNQADDKQYSRASIVETVPNTPSRIHPTANADKEIPATNITVPAESLTSVPLPLPTLEADVRHQIAESDAHPNTGIRMDEGTDVQQTPSLQPIKVVQPEYPDLAKLRHVEGDVLLQLQIDSSGNVRDARAISGNMLLREAAQKAARQWQYAPGSAGDRPAATWVQIKFKLNPEIKR